MQITHKLLLKIRQNTSNFVTSLRSHKKCKQLFKGVFRPCTFELSGKSGYDVLVATNIVMLFSDLQFESTFGLESKTPLWKL